MGTIIGLDTSCYTTSIAVWKNGSGIVHQGRKILNVPDGQRGLRQSDGFFQHVQTIPRLFDDIPKEYFKSLERIVVSASPRNQVGSYMPVFSAGMRFAEVASKMIGSPLSYTDHQSNHCFAALIDHPDLVGKEFLMLHLSGGTTELVLTGGRIMTSMRENGMEFSGLDETIIGKSLDVAMGQVIDRIGVAAGLPFPCGKHMEPMALQLEDKMKPIRFPKGLKGCDINLSGMEAHGLKYVNEGMPLPHLFKSLFLSIGEALADMIIAGVSTTSVRNVVCGGGVISNGIVRESMLNRLRTSGGDTERISVYFARPEYSTDHAVGCAYLGAVLEGWT